MFSGPPCQQNHTFEAVVRDPNDAGYKSMAESIDLNLLTTKP